MSNAGVLWRGPSLLDGREVALIVSGLKEPSSNEKTGDMIQTWILRTDKHPVTAKLSGEDISICGDCPLASGYGCYVNVHYAPAGLWRQLASGAMPSIGYDLPRDRPVRIGAYGDPAAVPIDVWRKLLPDRWTAFTHQWRREALQDFREFCMASTEDTGSTREAWAMGWRTFRLRSRGAPLMPGELECVERTHGVKCADCLLCRGSRLSNARSVSIEVHGNATSRAANVVRGMEMDRAGLLSAY